jgi:Ala-tRNA(Pro) deacylase
MILAITATPPEENRMNDRDMRDPKPVTHLPLMTPDPQDFTRAPEADVFAWLERHGLPVSTIAHVPTHTVAESRSIKTGIEGAHTKNLFMKDKRGQLVLISAHHDSVLPLNQLHRAIGCQRLSFTGAELLWDALKVTPGSVSAFALLHDTSGRVRFVLDHKLAAYDVLNFHPLRNDRTTSIARADFLTFVTSTRHTTEVVDFTQL